MKMKKFAFTAIMMSALTVTPLLPASMPFTLSANTITASAAENAIYVEVVDMMTGIPVDGVTVTAFDDSWNTSDVPSKKIMGAFSYDSIEFVLSDVPEEYSYNEKYVLDTNTRTYDKFIIRLCPKEVENNTTVMINNYGFDDDSWISDIPFNVYDEDGKWFTTLMSARDQALPEGDYVIKADSKALKNAGYRIIDPDGVIAQQERKEGNNMVFSTDSINVSIKKGGEWNWVRFDVEPVDEKVGINAVFKYTDDEHTEPAEIDGNIGVTITGKNFKKQAFSGEYYLPDGEYTAKLDYCKKITVKSEDGIYETKKEKVQFYDLKFTIEDGKPDTELIFKEKAEADRACAARIEVVDDYTLQYIDNIDVELISGINATSKTVKKWNTKDCCDMYIDDLMGISPYCYGIKLSNVPEEYICNDMYIFSFDFAGEQAEWTIKLKRSEKTETSSATASSATVKIIDKDTGEAVKDIHAVLTNALSGKYIRGWNTTDVPVAELTGLEGVFPLCYAVKLSEIPAKYSDCDTSYIFYFNEKGEKAEWVIELQAKEETSTVGSSATIKIVDKVTGKNIEGIDVELISGINATGKTLGRWNTYDEAEKTFTDLTGVLPFCYGVQLRNVPEKYDYNDKYVFSFDKVGETQEWTIELSQKTETVQTGSTAAILIVNKKTGQIIDDVDAELIAGINATGTSLGTWNTGTDSVKTFYELTGMYPFCYGVKLKNVPEKYEVKDKYVFSFDKAGEIKEWRIELDEKETPENSSSVNIKVVDSDTGKNVEGIRLQLTAKMEEGTAVIDKWNTLNEAEKTISGLTENEYSLVIKNLPEVYEIPDNFDDSCVYKLSFDKTGENKDITIKMKRTEQDLSEPIGFGLYGRFKGMYTDNSGVGNVSIISEDGFKIGTYDLDKTFTVPDGTYTATIFVDCKGLNCFSDDVIKFTVMDGKPDKKLNYNIEVWNFNEKGNGDANNDGEVSMADAVLIMQSIANPEKFGLNGSVKEHMTEEGSAKADVDGEGITNKDALTIQKYLLGFFNV